jgi:hypothetical protein
MCSPHLTAYRSTVISVNTALFFLIGQNQTSAPVIIFFYFVTHHGPSSYLVTQHQASSNVVTQNHASLLYYIRYQHTFHTISIIPFSHNISRHLTLSHNIGEASSYLVTQHQASSHVSHNIRHHHSSLHQPSSNIVTRLQA